MTFKTIFKKLCGIGLVTVCVHQKDFLRHFWKENFLMNSLCDFILVEWVCQDSLPLLMHSSSFLSLAYFSSVLDLLKYRSSFFKEYEQIQKPQTIPHSFWRTLVSHWPHFLIVYLWKMGLDWMVLWSAWLLFFLSTAVWWLLAHSTYCSRPNHIMIMSM